MDLIDRYILAVGRHLPPKNKVDILAELRSALLDTLDAGKDGEVTEEQVVALLKKYGAPQKVAASYWPEGQYLVGPRLYPLFRLVTGIALGAFVLAQLVTFGISLVFEGVLLPALQVFGNLANGLFIAFGSIVLVFAILQRLDVSPNTGDEDWDPRHLPALDVEDPIRRGGTVVEIAFSLVLIAILLYLPDRIGVVLTPGARAFLNPVILRYLPLIVVSILLGVLLDVFLLWRERWETGTRLAKVGLDLFSIYVLYLLVAGHTAWLAERGVTGFFSALAWLPQVADPSGNGFQIFVMQAFCLAFIVALVVSVVDAANMGYRWIRGLLSKPSTPVWSA
jgi:hypothetical protein